MTQLNADEKEPTIEEKELARQADQARLVAVRLVGLQGLGYLGQVMSSAELLTVAMAAWLRPNLDRFVLSPSHYVTGVYAVANVLGWLDDDVLETYGRDGSGLEAIGSERTPFVDYTCGSLAQGLSVGIGYALADRLAGSDAKTLVFSSDGEMEEGQTWEAALFAAHHRLDSLTVLLDCNDSQVDGPVSTVTSIEPVSAKWEAFGWEAHEVDGHDTTAIWSAMTTGRDGRPRVVAARTSPAAGLEAMNGTDAHFVKLSDELAGRLTAELTERIS